MYVSGNLITVTAKVTSLLSSDKQQGYKSEMFSKAMSVIAKQLNLATITIKDTTTNTEQLVHGPADLGNHNIKKKKHHNSYHFFNETAFLFLFLFTFFNYIVPFLFLFKSF